MTHESNDHDFINGAVAGTYCGAEGRDERHFDVSCRRLEAAFA
jgi:hypothetical protein